MRSRIARTALSNRVGEFLVSRPQLLITVCLLVLLVAVQGGAAALDGDFTIEPMGEERTDNGP
jgi:hypothetical protein